MPDRKQCSGRNHHFLLISEISGNFLFPVTFWIFSLQNVKKKMYGCTEAFLADAKWILHNCIIYNGGKILIHTYVLNYETLKQFQKVTEQFVGF